MLWPTDSGKMSVHSLGKIKEPLKPWNDFKLGDKGKASYPGYKELWDFEILAIGGKNARYFPNACMKTKNVMHVVLIRNAWNNNGRYC